MTSDKDLSDHLERSIENDVDSSLLDLFRAADESKDLASITIDTEISGLGYSDHGSFDESLINSNQSFEHHNPHHHQRLNGNSIGDSTGPLDDMDAFSDPNEALNKINEALNHFNESNRKLNEAEAAASSSISPSNLTTTSTTTVTSFSSLSSSSPTSSDLHIYPNESGVKDKNYKDMEKDQSQELNYSIPNDQLVQDNIDSNYNSQENVQSNGSGNMVESNNFFDPQSLVPNGTISDAVSQVNLGNVQNRNEDNKVNKNDNNTSDTNSQDESASNGQVDIGEENEDMDDGVKCVTKIGLINGHREEENNDKTSHDVNNNPSNVNSDPVLSSVTNSFGDEQNPGDVGCQELSQDAIEEDDINDSITGKINLEEASIEEDYQQIKEDEEPIEDSQIDDDEKPIVIATVTKRRQPKRKSTRRNSSKNKIRKIDYSNEDEAENNEAFIRNGRAEMSFPFKATVGSKVTSELVGGSGNKSSKTIKDMVKGSQRLNRLITNKTKNGLDVESEQEEDEIIEEVADDREGCRSLVCDSNGIIVAEMVYRCMICSNVAESISEAQKHYQIKHIGDDIEPMNPINRQAQTKALPISTSSPLINSNGNHSDEQEDYSFTSQEMPSFFNYDYTSGISGYDDFDPTQFLSQSFHTEPAPKKNRAEPIVNTSNNNTNTNNNGTSSSRGGYVTCAVCDITKFYASVQRRYGQFTCMGCAKFFGRFLMKPRRYYCLNLGSCPLDQSPRCKACLLLACIRTYVIDEKRMKIVNANRPLKRMGPGGSAISDSPSSQSTTTATTVLSTSKDSSKKESSLLAIPPTESSAACGHHTNARSKSSLKEDKLNSSSAINKKGNNSVTSNRSSPKRGSVESVANAAAVSSTVAASTAATAASNKRTSNSSNGTNPGRKVAGCRACSGCLAEDCGKCHYCLDKPKFGGGNTLKKKCVAKRCLMQGYKVKACDNLKKIKLTRKQ